MRLAASRLNYKFMTGQLQSLHSKLTFDYQLKAHPSVIRKLYRLAVPEPAEQQKIADCLASLDEVIAAQARKVEALRAHKRGLMQQLFPRAGETRPDRKSVVEGTSVSVRLDLGGRRIIKKKKK